MLNADIFLHFFRHAVGGVFDHVSTAVSGVPEEASRERPDHPIVHVRLNRLVADFDLQTQHHDQREDECLQKEEKIDHAFSLALPSWTRRMTLRTSAALNGLVM